MKNDLSKLIYAADVAGVFLFAIEGALAAIAGQMDLIGVMVLSFATALGGGIIRDVLIGAPPPAIRDWRYAVVAFSGGALTFLFYPVIAQIPAPVIVALDAAGLGLFAIAGTEKALAYGVSPLIAVLLGAITGVGGGTVRDVLLNRMPNVLHVDIYASAALAGSAFMVVGRALGMPPKSAAVIGGILCVAIRLVAVWQNWQMPKAIGA